MVRIWDLFLKIFRGSVLSTTTDMISAICRPVFPFIHWMPTNCRILKAPNTLSGHRSPALPYPYTTTKTTSLTFRLCCSHSVKTIGFISGITACLAMKRCCMGSRGNGAYYFHSVTILVFLIPI